MTIHKLNKNTRSELMAYLGKIVREGIPDLIMVSDTTVQPLTEEWCAAMGHRIKEATGIDYYTRQGIRDHMRMACDTMGKTLILPRERRTYNSPEVQGAMADLQHRVAALEALMEELVGESGDATHDL